MVYRSLNEELQIIAVQQLQEDPARIDESLLAFRGWLEKQSHLKIKAEDQILLVFLRGSKWSLQRAKEKLDYFYAIRTLLPNLLGNRDPYSEDIQRLLQNGVCTVLPKSENTNGPRICVLDCSRLDPKENSPIITMKLGFMIWDILLNEDDNFVVSGVKILVDCSKMPLSFLLQVTPGFLKQVLLCGLKVYPVRIKMIIAIHVTSAMETIFNNIVRPVLSKKIEERVVLYGSTNSEKMYNHIPKSLLPEKYGGENGSTQELIKYWKTKTESYQKWFLEDNNNICDENLRPGKPILYNEEFNMEGTFRKLNFD